MLLWLLQARPNSIAVFVPSEITTYCFYPGLQRDYMVRVQACSHPTSVHASVIVHAMAVGVYWPASWL